MIYLMLCVSIITWSLHFTISLILWMLGWIILPPMAYHSNVIEAYVSRFNRRLLCWGLPSVQRLFGNDEDGIDGTRNNERDEYGLVMQEKWIEQTKDYSDMRRIIMWSCWRNPCGNLRFIKPFGFIITPSRVHYVGNSIDPEAFYAQKRGVYWFFAWHGIYTGLWLIGFGFQLRVGWKLIPTDAHGLSNDDYRRKGCGFALQLQRVTP